MRSTGRMAVFLFAIMPVKYHLYSRHQLIEEPVKRTGRTKRTEKLAELDHTPAPAERTAQKVPWEARKDYRVAHESYDTRLVT